MWSSSGLSSRMRCQCFHFINAWFIFEMQVPTEFTSLEIMQHCATCSTVERKGEPFQVGFTCIHYCNTIKLLPYVTNSTTVTNFCLSSSFHRYINTYITKVSHFIFVFFCWNGLSGIVRLYLLCFHGLTLKGILACGEKALWISRRE